MAISITGLSSGMDWKSIVSQLAEVERAPEKQLQTEQSTITQRNNAYGKIKTELTTLNEKIDALKDSSLYGTRSAQSADSTIATATAASGTALGKYAITVSQLATSTTLRGNEKISSAINNSDDVSGVIVGKAGFAGTLTPGTFSINGKQVTIAATDTLQSVFDQISSVTAGDVTASYSSDTDTISLTSSSSIVLGSATDTSNFLQVAHLTGNNSSTITSDKALGGINTSRSLSAANFSTAVSDGGSGAGEFKINGVSIKFSANQAVTDVLTAINNSAAGVAASFDATRGQFVLTNKDTGDVGISMEDVTGNFLSATGLSDGTLTSGKNLIYSINGGGQTVSRSNLIKENSSGITGLAVTVLKAGTTTITVGTDTTGIQKAIEDFVSEYNKVQGIIDTYTASSTDSTGKVSAGILADESDASDIASGLRRTSYSPKVGSGTIKSLDDLGITTGGHDNNLTISDTTKLTEALSNNLSAVQDLFTNSTSGVATQLSAYMDKIIGDSGSLVAKQDYLTKQYSSLGDQITDLEKRVQDYSDQLTTQFVAMETAQQNYKTQLQYLQQNLGLSSSSSSSSTSSGTVSSS
jgi:flagellar hook-associated protein 2